MFVLGEDGQKTGIRVIGPYVSEKLFGENMVRWFNSMVIVVLLSTVSTITMVGGRASMPWRKRANCRQLLPS